MAERVCGNCRWFDARATGYGHCRRRSPIVMGEECFPSTHVTDWCGEWADATITPEQEERRQFVRQIFLAMTASEWGASYSEDDMWKLAAKLAAAEPQIQRENEQ